MPRRIALLQSDWPASDCQAWAAALRQGDVFDEGGVASHWRAKTIAQAKSEHGRWLAFIQQHDPAALALAPAARVTLDRVRDYVSVLGLRIAPVSVAAAIGHLILGLSAVAPRADFAWLKRIHRKLVNGATAWDKRPRMVTVAQLYRLGEILMASAEKDGVIQDYRSYRDGLMIALLACRPLRRANFAGLRLNRNVFIAGEAIRLHFDAEEMKGHRTHDCWVPDRLVGAFKRYVHELREHLPLAATHDAVWCGTNGKALQADAVYRMIIARTQAAFGNSVYMHLFRDIAATAIAIHRPEHIALARDLLGHTNLTTTERHYLHAQSVAAGEEYMRIVEKLRFATSTCRE